jgi:phosphoserine/homoserine phosphotransferase
MCCGRPIPSAGRCGRSTALNFRVIAAGDSYNDTAMLAEAEAGILFRPPQNVIDEFPQFPVARTFEEMREQFRKASVRQL